MQQLSGMDSLFLASEDGRQHMHIAALGIYDPSSAPGGSLRFKTMLDFFSEKINEVPFFRRRLVTAPFGLDRPYWIDDASIDVEYHVRHLSLPSPGDWRQLMIQVARLHSQPLDRSRPLWEVYIIGGLDNVEGVKEGSFAMYLKMHHAAVDGQAASKLIEVLHSTTPEYKPAQETSIVFADREPGNVELVARSVINRGRQAINATRLAFSASRSAVDLSRKHGAKALEIAQAALLEWTASPELPAAPAFGNAAASSHNRFDQSISPHRIIDAVGLPLEKCKVIREAIKGVTINDIFMATTGGAVRRYLQAHDELPDKSLNAMMPMAAAQKGNTANSVSMTIIGICTDIEDPIDRLLEINKSTIRSKELQEDIGRDLMGRLFDVMPAVAAKKLTELLVQRNCSLAISNVRGPAVPLYLAGARVQVFMPVSLPYDQVGLNVTGFSYMETLWVCVTACRSLMPDPGFFSECMSASFDELVEAASERR